VLRSFLALAALLMPCSYVSADDDGEFVGTDFDKTYTVTVTRGDLQKTPSWNKQTANPPLSREDGGRCTRAWQRNQWAMMGVGRM
jgi:hypothetical protein